MMSAILAGSTMLTVQVSGPRDVTNETILPGSLELKAELVAHKRGAQQILGPAIESAKTTQEQTKLANFLVTVCADTLEEKQRPDEARWACSQAYRLFDAASAKVEACRALLDCGYFSAEGSNFRQAVADSRLALAYAERHNLREWAGLALSNLGDDYNSLGHYADGVRCGREALAHLTGHVRRSKAWSVFASGSWYQGRYDEALHGFVASVRELPPQAKRLDLAIAIQDLGAVYQKLGELETARLQYARSVDLLRKDRKVQTGAALRATEIALARSYSNFAGLECLLGHYSRSKVYAEWSSRLRHSVGASYDDQVASHINLAEAEIALGDAKSARSDLGIAQQLDEKSTTKMFHGHLLADRADLDCKEGQYLLSAREASDAVPWLRALASPDETAEALRTLASAQRALHQPILARQTLEKALDGYEQAERHSQPALLTGVYLDTHQRSLYADLALDYAGGSDPVRALLVSDRGRGQGLLRALGLGLASAGAFLNREEAEIRANYLERIELARTQLTHTLVSSLSNSGPPSALGPALGELAASELRLNQLESELSRRSAPYARIAGADALTSDHLRSLLLANRDALFVEYNFGTRGSLAFSCSASEGVRATVIVTDQKRIRGQIRRWLETMRDESVAQESPRLGEPHLLARAIKLEKHLARVLYSEVLDPVLRRCRVRYRRIIFAADGDLTRLPFSALMVPSGERLIERYPLTSIVSLGSLTWTRPAQRAVDRLVIAEMSSKGSELSGAIKEAREVGELLRVRPTDSDVVRPTAILHRFTVCNVIHVATHASATTVRGFDPLIQIRSGVRGQIRPIDILGLHLRARLVVLSGCETAVGKYSQGDGDMGMAWAMLASGAQSVVGTRWPAKDRAAREQMHSFYDLATRGKRLDRSLQEAARTELRSRRHYLPYYWAGYVLYGRPGRLGY